MRILPPPSVYRPTMNKGVENKTEGINAFNERTVRCNNNKCKYCTNGKCSSKYLNIDFSPVLNGVKMVCRSFMVK